MQNPPDTAFSLLRRYLPDWSPKLILDVGANVGQSAKAFAGAFPEARIHSFEPSPDSFVQLVLATSALANVETHCLALGRVDETLGLTQVRASTMNRLVRKGKDLPEGAVMVPVRAGAEVMRALQVEHVDFLKIDTEGHDLEVLHGFLPMIDRIDLIQVEAGMNAYNRTHVPFARLDALLTRQGFHLMHLFDQKMEWKRGGRPVLRRCNPVYISGRLVDLQGIR
jgi:FkbM family methyltransferase